MTHNKIGHVFEGRRRHSSILDVRSFRWAVCDPDHYLGEGETGRGQRSCREDMERFSLKKLNGRWGERAKEEYQVTIGKKFVALENLEDNGEIKRAGDNIRQNIKISAQERRLL
jgi:hypothetical protein